MEGTCKIEGKTECGRKEKTQKGKEKEIEEETEKKRLKGKKEGLTCVPPCQFVWRERFFFLWTTYTLCQQGRNQDHFLQHKDSLIFSDAKRPYSYPR